jgi:hypothetical protein
MGRKATFVPAMQDKYGVNSALPMGDSNQPWIQEFRKQCDACATIKEATEYFVKDLGIPLSTIYNHTKIYLGPDYTFGSGDSSGKVGRKPTVIRDAAASLGMTEEETLKRIVALLRDHEGNTIKEHTKRINATLKLDMDASNIYPLMKRFEIKPSRERKTKQNPLPKGSSASTEGMSVSDVPVPKSLKIPVKYSCTTKGCKGEKMGSADRIGSDLHFGIKGIRCPECENFAMKGTFHDNGVLKTVSLVPDPDLGMLEEVIQTAKESHSETPAVEVPTTGGSLRAKIRSRVAKADVPETV